MECSSFFIKDRAIFGSFPSQKNVNELEELGVRYFINLTHENEKKIYPYTTKYKYIRFPIVDRHVPHNWTEFATFIVRISNIISSLKIGELVYLHCKGGHGRSGVVVASIFCYMLGMNPKLALEHTSRSHSNRSVMREKWRKLGSPQTYQQKNFIYKFFEPLIFYRSYKSGMTAGFSTFTPHTIVIDGFGTFYTAESAIQAYKNPYDKDYVEKQQKSISPLISKILGNKTEVRKDWLDVCEKLMYKIVEAKFNQNIELKENLMKTGLRPIVYHIISDSFWGDGSDGKGQNKLGKILMKLREQYYISN